MKTDFKFYNELFSAILPTNSIYILKCKSTSFDVISSNGELFFDDELLEQLFYL